MILNKKTFYVLLLCLTFLIENQARADVYIDINQGSTQPLPIALVDFNGTNAKTEQLGKQLVEVITANLQRSGLFSPIDQRSFISKNIDITSFPRFADWRIVNAQALLHGRISSDGAGIRVEFRLWDVFAESQMLGVAYNSEPENWRRIAHIISDAIYKRITGEQGYFDSRIVYIAESGSAKQRMKRLAIMDQDGANHKYLTDGKDLVLTPRFSMVNQEITYLSYFNNSPKAYLFNIQTGRQEVLGGFKGMTFSPRFSPNGKEVVLSYAKNGATNIYTLDLESKQNKQLTNGKSIDTSPSYSADGKKITFFYSYLFI